MSSLSFLFDPVVTSTIHVDRINIRRRIRWVKHFRAEDIDLTEAGGFAITSNLVHWREIGMAPGYYLWIECIDGVRYLLSVNDHDEILWVDEPGAELLPIPDSSTDEQRVNANTHHLYRYALYVAMLGGEPPRYTRKTAVTSTSAELLERRQRMTRNY